MTTERIDCRWRSMPPIPPSGTRAPTRLRNRRGAMVALLGISMTAIFVLAGLTLDFARLENLKAELRHSADAGAHAGAQALTVANPLPCINLLPPLAQPTATAIAQANLAMEGTVTVEDVDIGIWNGSTFGPPQIFGLRANAVRVTVSRQSTGLIMSVLGVPAPRLRATAIAAVSPLSCAISGPRRPVLVQ